MQSIFVKKTHYNKQSCASIGANLCNNIPNKHLIETKTVEIYYIVHKKQAGKGENKSFRPIQLVSYQMPMALGQKKSNRGAPQRLGFRV